MSEEKDIVTEASENAVETPKESKTETPKKAPKSNSTKSASTAKKSTSAKSSTAAKKSTSTKSGTTAKKTTSAKSSTTKSTSSSSSSSTAKKSTTKSTAAKSSTTKSTSSTAKSTTAKSASGTTKSAAAKSTSDTAKSTASKSKSGTTANKSTSAKSGAAKSSSAKSSTAKKSASTKSASGTTAKKSTSTKSGGTKKKSPEIKATENQNADTNQSVEDNLTVAPDTGNIIDTQTVLQDEQPQAVEQHQTDEQAQSVESEVAATQSPIDSNEQDASEQTIVIADAEQTEKFGKSEDVKELDKTDAAEQETKNSDEQPLLSVRNLKKYFLIENSIFPKKRKYLRAVDGVSFNLFAGKTIGIVGESGCGKTTMGRTILRLTDVTGGEVMFKGTDLAKLKGEALRKMRPQFQMIFQDPYSSLSPRMPVGEIIGEAVKVHKIVPKSEHKDYVLDIMQKCGLQTHYFERYPHEFSGGQRQRICIAKVLALKPQLVICDEPVSALDVSIQAQIINLFKDLQEENNLAYVFISHDLSVVEHISDDVGVMYLGNMVELAPKRELYNHPLHPYTEALLSAVPMPDPSVKMNRITLKGDIPSPANPPKGCKFHTRCTKCMEICKEVEPEFHDCGGGHFVACHLHSPAKIETPEKVIEEPVVTE